MAGLVAAALLSRAILRWNIPVPVCGFRELAGIPCPLCGGTRALASMTELDLLTAAAYNPLVLLAAMLVTGWTIVRVFDRLLGKNVEKRLRSLLEKRVAVPVLFGLIVLNWLYLIVRLR